MGVGLVRVSAAPTVPTAGPENYLEVLESLLGRWGLAVGHCGGKDTDNGDPREKFFFCFLLLLLF